MAGAAVTDPARTQRLRALARLRVMPREPHKNIAGPQHLRHVRIVPPRCRPLEGAPEPNAAPRPTRLRHVQGLQPRKRIDLLRRQPRVAQLEAWITCVDTIQPTRRV